MDHKDGISEKSIALEYVHFVSTECSNFRNNYTLQYLALLIIEQKNTRKHRQHHYYLVSSKSNTFIEKVTSVLIALLFDDRSQR